MFFAANVPKIPDGGWFPLLVAVVLVVQMTTWRRGRQLVAARLRRAEIPLDRRSSRRSSTRRAAGSRHRRVPVQGRRSDAAGAARQPRAPQGPARARPRRGRPGQRGRHGRRRPPGSRCPRSEPACIRSSSATGSWRSPTSWPLVRQRRPPRQARSTRRRRRTSSATRWSSPSEIEGMHPWREQLFVLLDRGADSAARFFDLPRRPRRHGRHPRRDLNCARRSHAAATGLSGADACVS